MEELSFRVPLHLPVAEGATTPDPGKDGVVIWSTEARKHLAWDTGSWKALAPAAGGSASPGGGENSVQRRVGAGFSGSAGHTYDPATGKLSLKDAAGGHLEIGSVAQDPQAPSSDSGQLYFKTVAGQRMLHTAGTGALGMGPMGPWRGLKNVREVRNLSSGNVSTLGTATQVSGGRIPAINNLSLLQQTAGFEFASTATAGTGGWLYTSSNPTTCRLGFIAVIRFGVVSSQADNKVYAGLQDTSFNSDQNVDWLNSTASFNRLGLAVSSATGNWHIHQKNGTAITNTDLGVGFAFAANELLELVLSCDPGPSTVIRYRVRKYTGIGLPAQAEALGSLSENNYGPDTQLYLGARASNGTSAGVAAVRVPMMYLESEF